MKLNLKYTLRIILCFVLITIMFSLFLVIAEENVNHETNNNNSVKTSDVLNVGVVTIGRLSDKKDVDYFKIETLSTGDILFNFNHEGDGVYTYYWYAEVIDSDNNVINSGNLSGKDPTDFSVLAVKPGTYYLKISVANGGNPFMNGFSSAPYMISVKTKCLTHPELSDWVVTKEPSCLQQGEHTQNCVVCNTPVVIEPIKSLEHSYTEWSVIEEAGFFRLGEKHKTCVLCGEVVEQNFASQSTIIVLIAGALVILIIVIIAGINGSPNKAKSVTYNVGPYKNSTSNASSGGSGNGGNGDSGEYSYNGNASGSTEQKVNFIYEETSGSITVGGETYSVHTQDAEGYSTDPYIEDAEGYKTRVNPDDVEPPFNWLDC